MSFLAGLRTIPSKNQQSLQLCYQFSVDNIGHRLYLQLFLTSEKERTQNYLDKTYRLQREHLARPPAFMTVCDREILQQLSDTDAALFDCDKLDLSTSLSWSLLKKIVETQRSFFQKYSSKLERIHLAEPQPVEPFWTIDPAGTQELCWRLTGQGVSPQLLFLTHHMVYFTAMGSNFIVGPCQPTQSNNQAPKQISIAAQDVDSFLIQAQKKWQHWDMPLPKSLPAHRQRAELKPLLLCTASSSNKHKADEMQLQFSLCNEDYCTLPMAKPGPTVVWDGAVLQQLMVDEDDLQQLRKEIEEVLQSFNRCAELGNVWRPETTEDWQQIFGEVRRSLSNHNVSFSIDPSFSHHYVLVDQWHVCISEHESSGLNVNIQLSSSDGHIDLRELLAQIRAYNLQTNHDHLSIPLTDGRIVLMPARDIVDIMEEIKDFDFTSEGIYLAEGQFQCLANLQEQLPEDTSWVGQVDHLDEAIALHQSPIVLDKHLDCVNATLRPYQWLGVSWIRHLKQHHCNGLLADDMGLGKTLQTLTYLAFEKQQGELTKPALIVMPLSLVHNWGNEIEKFVSQLRYKIIHGSKRHEEWSTLNDYDILITTYHSAANDLRHWKVQGLSWLILDEAQNIKNSSTQFSQALREIPSENKLCLSGTPVENHLGELWSIISFLMPGCLGSLKYFKMHYQKPIEQEGNEKRLEQLLKRVAPFMLRRTKDQIAVDLPEKTEILQLIPLVSTQQEFYDQLKRETWEELQGKMADDERKGQHHMAALTALLKLRQACCDPRLFPDADINLPSAKREYCVDMIEELVAENRAVLVFSQFTKMLDILEESLNEKNIPSLLLTGKTRHRQATVDAFQRGDAPVFLISLKAGGAGLNLTRADTVIHYDPWWNSAAEKQASDRAHRIGQEKPVFVYKLIAENTIEEKIAQLQAQKASIIANVDNQAQLNAETFALKFEELLMLWQEETIV